MTAAVTGVLEQLQLLQSALKLAEEVLPGHAEEVEKLWVSLAKLHTLFASEDAAGTAGRYSTSFFLLSSPLRTSGASFPSLIL